DRKARASKTEEEIRNQFEEERKVFLEMVSWKNKYDSLPEDKKNEAEIMFENLERARSLHDNLAKMVMENFALEVEIRVKYPESFWNISTSSFKKDIWQNNIVKNGLKDMDHLEKIISPLFSPEVEFIYPLAWAWSEQIV